MLAVKKLCDVQRVVLQAGAGQGAGQGALRHKAPRRLHLVSMETSDPSSECSSPRSPMMSFQDSELSAELQSAMSSSHAGREEGVAFKHAVGVSQSQDNVDLRSRGSGRPQEPPTASVNPQTWSQETLEGSQTRNLPEGWDQRPLQHQPPPKQVPLGTATVFKYPPIPTKPKLSGSHGSSPPGPSPCGPSPRGSPALKGFSYLHSQCGSSDLSSSPRSVTPPTRRTQNATRCALSDGEPDEDDEDLAGPPRDVPSYATLTRRPGRRHLARFQSSPERNGLVGRSQSFAVRSRKKGPPPPPPKRLSSVSSTTSGELSDSSPPSSSSGGGGGGVMTDSPGSVRSIAASLEGGSDRRAPPGPKQDSPKPPRSTETREACGARRKVQSQCVSSETSSSSDLDPGPKSDSEEEAKDQRRLGGASSPQNSSSECIPFAEEGNLTIKQRPKGPGPPRAEAVLEPPDRPAAEVPEFNLKESDTVKRRHKPKDQDQDSPSTAGPESTGSESDGSRPPSRNQDRTGLERPDSPARGSPIKPQLSPKPAVTPKPVRQSLLTSRGES